MTGDEERPEIDADAGIKPFDEEEELGPGAVPSPEVLTYEFQAWHRPRKQFVRKYQWLKAVERVVDEARRRRQGGATDLVPRFSYLGLPAEDLLDIRLFRRSINEPDLSLRYLGFNRGRTGAEARSPESAHQQLMLSENVDSQSDIEHDDIRALGSRASVAFQHMTALGPFDAVNLDLCDHLLADPPGAQRTYYTALSEIIGAQAVHRDRWSLFVTTRISKEGCHPAALEMIWEVCREAFEKCPDLALVVEGALGVSIAETVVDELDGDKFFFVAAIGVSLWLGNLCRPANNVRLDSCMAYVVEPTDGVLDLVSYAFLVTPLRPGQEDASGLAAPQRFDDLDAYCRMAGQLANRVLSRTDVDKKLVENAELKQVLINETAALLTDANYDSNDYLQFVARFAS